jgi:hypothetical protein
MKRFIITLAVASGFFAQAQQPRNLVTVKPLDWEDIARPTRMESGSIYYMLEWARYKKWREKRPTEHKFLNLFPDYREPEIEILRNGITKEQHVEEIRVISTKTRMIMDKPAAAIDLSQLLDENVYAQLMPDMKHQFIGQDQIMPVIAGRVDPQTFAACKPSKLTEKSQGLVYFSRPQKERLENTKKAMAKNRRWCDVPGVSKCVRSCVAFEEGDTYWNKVAVENMRREQMGSERLLDYGMVMESELRFYRNETEFGASVSELTGLTEPVYGIFEQSIFYWNQMVQYGKILAVLQAHPSDPGKSVISNYLVIGVKESSFKKIPFLMEFLMGNFGNDAKYGITEGIPNYTQKFTNRTAAYFAK